MLTKTINYTDFNGQEQTEDARFHLSKPELVRLDLEYDGGLEARITKAVSEKDNRIIMQLFERLIKASYGVKSEDGRRFVKSPEVVDAFVDSAAYNELFMELLTTEDAAVTFFKAVMPDMPEESN